MIKNFFVPQTSVNDCGFATFAMILNLNNIKFNKDILKKELNRNEKGISAYSLVKTASKYNLIAQGYKNFKITPSFLPLIAVIVNENNLQHFVVVLKIGNRNILIADPYVGIVKMKKEEFYKKYTGICITFKKNFSFIKNILINRKVIILIVFLSILIAFLSIVFSYSLSLILKMMENGKSNKNMIFVLLIFLVIGVIKEVFVLLKNKLSLKFQLLMDKVFTIPFIEKLLSLPHVFYQKSGTGELISKINDLSHIKEMIISFVEILFVNLILIILSIMVSIFIDARLIILNCFITFLMFLINKCFLNKHFYKTYDLQIKNERLNNSMTDIFSGILTIKNLGVEKYTVNKIKNTYNDVIGHYKNLTKSFHNKEFITSLIIILVDILLIMLMIILKFPIPKIVFIISVENIIINSLYEVLKLQPLYFNFKSCYLRIKDIYNENKENYNESITSIESIYFDNLVYKYEDKTILNKISLKINKGEWIMITGPTGSGKSTLFKLLTKQIESSYDDIYINGFPLNEYDISSCITYVDQKARLFNWSIGENISFEKKDFMLACKVSLVEEFIKKNSFSYDYIIDNTNSNLSGGERQKIIIAQTLCNCSDLIIFDETTSELDSKTERKILCNIKKYYPDKTIILITHRNKNADLFDKKIILENGTIKRLERRINDRIKK